MLWFDSSFFFPARQFQTQKELFSDCCRSEDIDLYEIFQLVLTPVNLCMCIFVDKLRRFKHLINGLYVIIHFKVA